MSQTSTLKGQCIAELLGTGLLIFFGVGCVAALKVAGASFGQWEVSVIWGLEVAMTVYLVAEASGAHLNPAVAIALWLFAYFDKHKVIPFIVLQAAGTFCIAALICGPYYNLFLDLEQIHHIIHGNIESVDPAGTLSTYPNPHINLAQAFAVRVVIIVILMGLVLALTDDGDGVSRGPLAPLLVGLLIAVIGASTGLLTGFAMNSARNFDPKVFAQLTGWGNVAFTGGRDAPYFLVPFSNPIVGVIVGVFTYRELIGHHLSCDICVVEEKETTIPSEQKASL